MSSLEAAGGIGGETAADGNPFSLPDLDAAGADDETAHMTAGQRVGLGYGIADQGSAASDSAGGHSRLPAQAAALENAPSAKGKQSHGTSEVRDHYAARSVEPSSASESNCVCRGAPLVTTHEGERGSRVHSAAAQDDAAQPAAWVPSSKTAHQALFPPALDSAIQRGEQTGGGIDPLTGMPEKRKRWTKQDKLAAWDKAKQIPGQDATKIRQDVTGRTLHWNDYGKETDHGWDVDHLESLARGGDNQHFSLQALQWKINRQVKRDKVQMQHGDVVTFQDVPRPKMTEENFDNHSKFVHALNTNTLGNG